MIDEATYNELDRYFHSQMSAEEKDTFDSRMNANEELRAEFQWLNTMLGGMKQQGRSVMKSTIAGAIAGISYDEVEKYEPSVNRKSFFKKYWWVVTAAVVAIGVVIAIYLYTTQHSQAEGHDEYENALPLENMMNADSIGAGGAGAGNDSCAEPAQNLRADSIFKTAGEGRIAIRETVDVHYRYGAYYEQADQNRMLTHTKTIVENDTFNRHTWKAPTITGGVEDDTYRKEKKKSMGVTTGYKPYPPYTYKLDDDLMLNAPYYSCKGFTWEGMGSDTVYMTTKDGITYMLLRGKGVKELVPVTGRGATINYNPVRK